MDLGPVVLGKGHKGKYIVLGIVHQPGDFCEALAQTVRDLAPLVDGGLMAVLDEGGSDGGGDHEALSLGNMGQGIPHEMDPVTLQAGVEHLGGRRLEALVDIRDDQPDATQAQPGQRA